MAAGEGATRRAGHQGEGVVGGGRCGCGAARVSGVVGAVAGTSARS
jgi:hypothetical protein